MLYDAGRQLLGDGRFRLWSLDVGGKTIAAQLLLAAGGSASFFISGFDDRWSSLAPSVQTMVTALEDCFSQRYARLDLGLGAEPYKLVLADGVDQLAWVALFPRDLHYPLTRVQALPAHVRFRTRMLANHLPPRTKARLLRALPGCFRDR